MASSSITKLSLKLLIDTKREKVLFAEASKAVIDFLFNLLCLPVGAVVRLLNKNGMVGSIGNLYESVKNLDETYMQPNQDKDVLLKPRAPISSTEISGLLSSNEDNADGNLETSFYMCPCRCNYNVTCVNNTPCPQCRRAMNAEVSYVGRKVAEERFSENGFVKEVVTYMVMDDLVVQPMSTISSITLLNKFNIKEVGILKERVVEMGMTEGINLLKASLQSESVLTSVFLKKNKGAQGFK
ncbi:uncharacterized protein LOC133314742 [Gastrolobium bilobum]|uniref:uncharacterized protein LOC133314742 n=1 Tax=Gastrolobium bilobum TaxID=150636 RepID=UPI002AB1723F|nr:uncharacterized protein LOC133314742 [Gastrolobium bilobum]